MILEVEHLTKKYGALTAVDDLGLTADEGEIVALVGPDGAGKTSLFRSICGLMDFDDGRVEIAGHKATSEFDLIKPLLGYMPQAFSLYPDLSVEENLRFYAGLFGLNRRRFDSKKEPLYGFSGLGPFADRRAANLSGGMKQKLALSCALIHDPKVLILDEPTTGVDPLSRRQFWEILRTLRDEGSAIVVSTPYMDEVALSDRAVFVHRGRELTRGTPEDIVRQYRGRVFRINLEPTAERMDRLDRLSGLAVRRFGSGIHMYAGEDMPHEDVIKMLSEERIGSDLVAEIPAELEDVFIQMMEMG